MQILILGGTAFLGRALAALAHEQGHEVTLFHRGKTNPGLFPHLEHVYGDRDDDLSALEGRNWDVVVDTSGQKPSAVARSAQVLAANVGLYMFISTISVYRELGVPGQDERAPVEEFVAGTPEDPSDASTYGARKAASEAAVQAIYGDRALIIRPGMIVGPYDYSERFTYWVRRGAAGGTILAPGRPELPVQLIDVRDLAAWLLELAERRAAGVFNATGPAYALTFGGMVEACRAGGDGDGSVVWVGEDFLLARGVTPFSELPFWLPSAGYAGIFTIDCGRALAAGLRCRPLIETVRDTLAWDRQREPAADQARPAAVGLSPEREQELLAAWLSRGER